MTARGLALGAVAVGLGMSIGSTLAPTTAAAVGVVLGAGGALAWHLALARDRDLRLARRRPRIGNSARLVRAGQAGRTARGGLR